ncbi:MAG: cryptochrome/photolyase family protein [Spirochaetota bacterium]
METVLLIVMGNQLYPNHKVGMLEGVGRDYAALGPAPMPIFMAEDMQLCSRFRYHRHKLLLILSAMRSHHEFLRGRHDVYYYRLEDRRSYFEKLRDAVQQAGADALAAYEPDDFALEANLNEYAERLGLPLHIRPSKSFLQSGVAVRRELDTLKTPRMHNFYTRRRTTSGVLMNGSAPEGGRWSFDPENRRPFPKDIQFLPLPKSDWTRHTRELSGVITELFPENPGDPNDFFLPTTRVQALKWLDSFLQYRLELFGPYEDAIHQSELLGFHSLLSPLMNIGLLFPGEVLDAAVERDVPLASKEGFVRQVMGWREFVRGMYLTREMRGNFFQHQRKLSPAWYRGTTGIPILDDSIKRVLRYGYVHHIERLMVIGNIMLLSEIHPDEVYRWFSELFVDAYEWVMLPNVYGMSQFADGGSFATKPYIASSRYLLKMSNYSKGEWCDVVDGLYWRFVSLHRPVFETNPRMKLMTSWLDKMDPARYRHLKAFAEDFIKRNTI